MALILLGYGKPHNEDNSPKWVNSERLFIVLRMPEGFGPKKSLTEF